MYKILGPSFKSSISFFFLHISHRLNTNKAHRPLKKAWRVFCSSLLRSKLSYLLSSLREHTVLYRQNIQEQMLYSVKFPKSTSGFCLTCTSHSEGYCVDRIYRIKAAEWLLTKLFGQTAWWRPSGFGVLHDYVLILKSV